MRLVRQCVCLLTILAVGYRESKHASAQHSESENPAFTSGFNLILSLAVGRLSDLAYHLPTRTRRSPQDLQMEETASVLGLVRAAHYPHVQSQNLTKCYSRSYDSQAPEKSLIWKAKYFGNIDWCLIPNSHHLTKIMTNHTTGGNGDPRNSRCIKTGNFSVQATFPYPHCVRRDWVTGAKADPQFGDM